jgi:hypothetical protein
MLQLLQTEKLPTDRRNCNGYRAIHIINTIEIIKDKLKNPDLTPEQIVALSQELERWDSKLRPKEFKRKDNKKKKKREGFTPTFDIPNTFESPKEG